MKINYQFVSRALIALLFVIAGVQKIAGFGGISGYIDSLGLPLPTLVTILVILIEIPVAIAFAWGYRLCTTGMILIAFTALATILVHNPWGATATTPALVQLAMLMALKNIAIIGGILSTITLCNCGKCLIGKGCGNCKDCKGDKKCEKCATK